MGSFIGHVVPGTFFFCFSIWWLYNIFFRYYSAKRFKPSSYKNISSFPCPCSPNFPLESVIKVVAVIIGMLGEFFTGIEHGRFTHWGNSQHMTMFFFFGINGLIDILQYKKWEFPPKMDYLSAALAFSIEGFLFYHHLHGRPMMDVMVHMFLFYLIVACVISVLLEMLYPKNVVPALCRVLFTLLQGTWFYQVGFILYPPIGDKWQEDDHDQMMIVTVIFTWHIVIALFTIAIFGALIRLRVAKIPGSAAIYHMISTGDESGVENIFSREDEFKSKNGHLPMPIESESDEI